MISNDVRYSAKCTKRELNVSAYLQLLLHKGRKFAKTLEIPEVLLYNLIIGNVYKI